MPLNPDSPRTEDVPVVTQKPVNHYAIVAVLIYKPRSGDTRLEVHWEEGHDDGAAIHWKSGVKKEWALALPSDGTANPNGDEFLALLAEAPNGADNYEVNKNAGYRFLTLINARDPNHGIPAGAVV